MITGSDGVAMIFSMFLFPELMNKSKEEMIDYANTIKENGKITDKEYQKALDFINKVDEIKQILKDRLKNGEKS